MENVPNLPQELLEDILIRLPYKSLVRFKCVCKHWYALFHYPIFLSRHLSNFIQNHNSGHSVLLRLSFPTLFGDGLENYKLFSLSATDADFSAVETLIPKFNMLSTKFQICGHCNGILCLSIDYWPRSKEVLLYNPATREFRCLPDNVLRLKPSSVALAVGMGYDPITDDYKVLRIWRVDAFDNGGVFRGRTNRVEEYALNTDSWTLLNDTNAGNFAFETDCFAMYFKRTYYWWAFSREDKSSIIVAFDMEDEVFQRVLMPPHIDISEPDGRSLAVWNDSISLICCTYHDFTTSIDIWVMDLVGAEGSWTLMRSIKHLREEPKPLVFWKGNELLMEMSCGKIESYNVDTEEIKDVMIEGYTVQHSSQAVNYVASTVSLKGGGNYLI
ncbi:F-box/kelch-repeat protein At3g06240-like [Gastrolobium bilobum]|uniref:F-box/kelch-repeat protein At3g06240-like n=1 Tax=Gastrolobium bilobum TaxID=150636 RepID=UPI002AAF5550|nr:F-box/kelch-repeat protein At3g06240-like [Gastrolobium bilobum]